eukprot:8192403-Lingulodinium_polyedra.AAC.1
MAAVFFLKTQTPRPRLSRARCPRQNASYPPASPCATMQARAKVLASLPHDEHEKVWDVWDIARTQCSLSLA